MKKIEFLIFLVLFAYNLSATTVNGRFVVVKSDTSTLSVKLQINTDTGKDDMGGATIVISFDKNVLSFNSSPVINKDFTFHNFSGGNYKDASVTKPLSDKLWINIVLPKENNDKGTMVSGLNGWTDVVTINFGIKNPHDTSTVKWLKSNLFWQIYDADNTTSWSVGKFTDLAYAPAKVQLLSFTAQLLDKSDVQLDWSTICYEDNAGFEIEKSQSNDINNQASLVETNWEKIGFISSKNILNSPVNYTFVDKTANTNLNLKYRLKSVNKDASFSILSEIELDAQPLTFELQQNYPNPFNPSTKIRYTIPNLSKSGVEGATAKVTLKVYDVLGNEVTTLVNEEQTSGQHEVLFDAKGLASGVYIYKLETPDFTSTKKMILLR